jgi:hypothetical protein
MQSMEKQREEEKENRKRRNNKKEATILTFLFFKLSVCSKYIYKKFVEFFYKMLRKISANKNTKMLCAFCTTKNVSKKAKKKKAKTT